MRVFSDQGVASSGCCFLSELPGARGMRIRGLPRQGLGLPRVLCVRIRGSPHLAGLPHALGVRIRTLLFALCIMLIGMTT